MFNIAYEERDRTYSRFQSLRSQLERHIVNRRNFPSAHCYADAQNYSHINTQRRLCARKSPPPSSSSSIIHKTSEIKTDACARDDDRRVLFSLFIFFSQILHTNRAEKSERASFRRAFERRDKSRHPMHRVRPSTVARSRARRCNMHVGTNGLNQPELDPRPGLMYATAMQSSTWRDICSIVWERARKRERV